jgi:hypothetical protein
MQPDNSFLDPSYLQSLQSQQQLLQVQYQQQLYLLQHQHNQRQQQLQSQISQISQAQHLFNATYVQSASRPSNSPEYVSVKCCHCNQLIFIMNGKLPTLKHFDALQEEVKSLRAKCSGLEDQLKKTTNTTKKRRYSSVEESSDTESDDEITNLQNIVEDINNEGAGPVNSQLKIDILNANLSDQNLRLLDIHFNVHTLPINFDTYQFLNSKVVTVQDQPFTLVYCTYNGKEEYFSLVHNLFDQYIKHNSHIAKTLRKTLDDRSVMNLRVKIDGKLAHRNVISQKGVLLFIKYLYQNNHVKTSEQAKYLHYVLTLSFNLRYML